MVKQDTMTTTSRLKWALSFANDDLEELREGDWLNLRDDIGRFLGIGVSLSHTLPAFAPAVVGTQPAAMSEDAIRDLQAATRALIRNSAGGTRRPTSDAAAVYTGSATPIKTSVSWTLFGSAPEQTPPRMLVLCSGELRDVFLNQLVFLLLEAGPSNLRRCPAPGCERIFWKFGRRKYCSQRCTNRAVFQAWSKTEMGKTRSKREVEAAKQRRKYRAGIKARREGSAP